MIISIDAFACCGVRENSFLNPQHELNSASLAKNTADIAVLERAVYQQINEYRISRNLSPLTVNELISQQARMHSENMARGIVEFSHEGFQQRISALKTTIAYRSAAENLAYNQGYADPATSAVAGWLDSLSHRQNIEGNYNLTGIGIAKNQQGEYYFTQLFILQN
jgi:uncharacterized protein YkwD